MDDTIYLTEEDYDQLVNELDQAPKVNQKLKELFNQSSIFRDTNGKR